jgi:hypothetical protein
MKIRADNSPDGYAVTAILDMGRPRWSLATYLGWARLARLRDTTKSQVVLEKKLAGVHGFRLEGRAVGRDEPPVRDLAAQQIDETKRRKVLADARVGEISGLREDEPNAVVFRLLRAVTQHKHDLLSNIDGETRKHGPDFGLERSQGFEDERIGCRSPLGPDLPGDTIASRHTARIAQKESHTAS